MRKVFSVFRSDWRRLTASVVTVVVIIGLCLVPCLYAWFNIFSNWDPYGTSATSNIHIAVASEDEGRDILGVKLNIGDMVIDALHSNDQMGWQFLDTREEALAGVESGEYYAALIMPTDLTSDFVSILEGDLRHPQIQYYENEKKNAIAPKITSKAKTAVQEEINSTVIETVANAVTTANSVFNALGLDAQDVAQRLTVHLEDASASMAQLSATLQSLQSLSDQAGNLIGCAGIVIDDVGNVLQSGQSTIGSASQLLPENAELTEVIDALDRVDQQLDRVPPSRKSSRSWPQTPSSTSSPRCAAPCSPPSTASPTCARRSRSAPTGRKPSRSSTARSAGSARTCAWPSSARTTA